MPARQQRAADAADARRLILLRHLLSLSLIISADFLRLSLIFTPFRHFHFFRLFHIIDY
jgi:hypothetical protein